ncbi:hypothetical protein D3C76_1598760 [compost metagenome]
MTQPKFASILENVVFRSRTASGMSAKLPVTNSSPSRMIITKPTGKISAPTIPSEVWAVAVKASVVAKAKIAPARNPLTSI